MSTPAEDRRVVIEPADPHSDEVARLLTSYFAEVQATFGFNPDLDSPTDGDEFVPPHGRIFVVRDTDGTANGCGAVRLIDPGTAEIKRMWLHPSMRGRGAGWALLTVLEKEAVALGASRGVLDTNAMLTSALALYRAAGWVEVAAYNTNDNATHWFAKDLLAS
jgi:GNAT superfamily N-acetyltransferase